MFQQTTPFVSLLKKMNNQIIYHLQDLHLIYFNSNYKSTQVPQSRLFSRKLKQRYSNVNIGIT